VVLAAAALGACNDDPTSYDANDTTALFVNPTVMVLPAGRESKLVSRAVNPGNEPTYADVTWAIDPTLGCVDAGVSSVGTVSVIEDPDRLVEIQPPGLFVVTAGTSLGQTCIELSSAGLTEIVKVTVVGDDITLVCPDAVRAGATGTLDATLIGLDGTAVTPFDQTTDVVWASDLAEVVSVDAEGNFVATESGTAEISATWSGTDGTGTAGLGATRTATCNITVGGDVPASAAFAVVDTLGSIGTYVVGDTIEFEVEVYDALGNLTFDPDEITGITVTSSDPAVATATASREALTEDQVVLTVTVITIGPGVTTLSGVVETTEGDLAYEATLAVAAPNITAIAPDPAGPEDALTVTGAGLTLPGVDPVVTFNGFEANNVTVVSATELTVDPPLFGDGGSIDVIVSVSGVVSNTFVYTQNGQWDAEDYEPDNDDLPTTVNIGSPLNFTGSVSPDDVDDLFRVVVTESTTFDLTADWDDAAADLDVAFVNAGFTAYVCSDGATGAKPENTTCSLTPGTYYLWINFYDGPGVANYTITSN
jgi:hypothetical protein